MYLQNPQKTSEETSTCIKTKNNCSFLNKQANYTLYEGITL